MSNSSGLSWSCLCKRGYLCISASLYSFCQRCHLCFKHIIFPVFNSLSVSFLVLICSVSLHIYVNLIYLHFIVIYGLLCDFIHMFCTEATSRWISVSRSLFGFTPRTWRLCPCPLRQPPRASRLVVVPLAYNLLSFILTYTSTCPYGGPRPAHYCVATLVARCSVPHAALA